MLTIVGLGGQVEGLFRNKLFFVECPGELVAIELFQLFHLFFGDLDNLIVRMLDVLVVEDGGDVFVGELDLVD